MTRSNKELTGFVPIQEYAYGWSFLFSLSGDGRLGPLDLLMSGTPNTSGAATGIYYSRILPELSVKVSHKSLGGGKFKLKVKVTDAGDAVGGATVSAKGQNKITNASGKAKLTITGSTGHHVTLKITDPGYQVLTKKIKL